MRAVVRKLPLTPRMLIDVAMRTPHDDVDEPQACLGLAMLLGYAVGGPFLRPRGHEPRGLRGRGRGCGDLPLGPQIERHGEQAVGAPARPLRSARGGRGCVVARLTFFKAKSGWDTGPFFPFDYGKFLRRYRAVL